MPQAPIPPDLTVLSPGGQTQQDKQDSIESPKRPPVRIQGTSYDRMDNRGPADVAKEGVSQAFKGMNDYVHSFSPIRGKGGNLSVEVPEAFKSAASLLMHPIDSVRNAVQPVATVLQGIHSMIDPSKPAPSSDEWGNATRALSSMATGLLSGYGHPPGMPSSIPSASSDMSGLPENEFQQPGLTHQPSGAYSGGPKTNPGPQIISNEKIGGYPQPKAQKLLPAADQKALPAAPSGPPQLNKGPATLPEGTDAVEPPSDPRLTSKYATTKVGKTSPPAVMGNARLGEEGPIPQRGPQDVTPTQIPMGRHPAGTVVAGEKVGGRIRPMTEVEIQQLVQERGTAGRTAAPVDKPAPPTKKTK